MPPVPNHDKVFAELRGLLNSRSALSRKRSKDKPASGSVEQKCELIQAPISEKVSTSDQPSLEVKNMQSYSFNQFDVVQYSDGSDHHYGHSGGLQVKEVNSQPKPHLGKLKTNFDKLLSKLHILSTSEMSVHPTSSEVSHLEKQPSALLESLTRWARQIQKEWKILGNSLPDSIFVRVYEDRLDLLTAVIIGSHGTPYQHGLFFFDFYFPPNYPDVPPKVYYHSHGFRLNPNLYSCGMVCLSLLSTWSGKGCEQWNPDNSTVLQVLVSIQGLVLNEDPYYNEPMVIFPNNERALSYKDTAFILSCKTMICKLRKPPKHFECFVEEHFQKQGDSILSFCESWTREIKARSVEASNAAKVVGNKKKTFSVSALEKESESQTTSVEDKQMQKSSTSHVNFAAVKSLYKSICKKVT